MTTSDNTRTQRLAEWANRLAREIILNHPESQREQALKDTWDDIAAQLAAEIRKANPGADGCTVFWLTYETIFPGIIDRVSRAARKTRRRPGGRPAA
jgi:hypothetical protein